MKQGCLKIVRWFLPVLFISYMAGITLFTHSHVVNGVTIVHSHPFKKDSAHSHTTVEFQLIHLLSHVATTGAGIFFSLFSLLLICSIPFRGVRIGQDTVRPSWACGIFAGTSCRKIEPLSHCII